MAPPAREHDSREPPIAVRRHPVVTEVAHQLDHACLVPTDARLVLGVSGGGDSTALLLAATVLRDRQKLRPTVVHVHHHLRGDDADEDASFVEALCVRWAVPFRMEHVYPAEADGNIAEAAREMRYAALTRVAREIGAPYVAVAHHADDQFETMLIALCRGTGLDGLRGMAWHRPLREDVILVRPMLGLRHPDCLELCDAAGIAPRDDPFNADPSQLRGRLRRDVLPALTSIFAEAPRRAGATGDIVEVARRMFNEHVIAAFGPPEQREWSRPALAEQPAPVISAGLRRAALTMVPAASDAFGQRVVSPAVTIITEIPTSGSRKQFDWPGGLTLTITATTVSLHHPDHP